MLVFSLASVANGGGGVGFLGRNKGNLGANSKLHRETYKQEVSGYPNTKLFFGSEFATVHPTQKPVTLFEYLIRTYTNPGDIVVDPTAGSMTTAIAAINTGRGYICMEKDPEEYAKGLRRIESHIAKPAQLNLLEPDCRAAPQEIPRVSQLSLLDLAS